MKPHLDPKTIEFLQHSNYIEREYSEEALKYACKAWGYAVRNRGGFSLDYILNIHKILINPLNPFIAGKLRDCAVSIGGVYKPKLSEKQLTDKINNWIMDYNSQKNIDYDKIKDMHINFEELHPFRDGNGRTGRILMNIQCINAKLPIIILHEGKEQADYYRWFRR
jgi:Fic family protein